MTPDDPAHCLTTNPVPSPMRSCGGWSAAILKLQRSVPSTQAHGVVRRIEIKFVAQLTAMLRPEDAGAAAERALSHKLHDCAGEEQHGRVGSPLQQPYGPDGEQAARKASVLRSLRGRQRFTTHSAVLTKHSSAR